MVLEIILNFCSDVSHKKGEFSEILSEKDFKFILSKKSNIIAFNLSLVLLLAKVDLVTEEKSCKKTHLKLITLAILKKSLHYQQKEWHFISKLLWYKSGFLALRK